MLRGLGDRVNSAISGVLPERRLIVRSETTTRYLRLSPLAQASAAALAAGFVGWAGYATLSLAETSLRAIAATDQFATERGAYDARVETLNKRTVELAEALSLAEARAAEAGARLAEQHASMVTTSASAREAIAALRATRSSLATLATEHDDTLELCEATAGRLASVRSALDLSQRENLALTDTLAALNGALGDVAEERDAASETTASLSLRVDELSSEISEGAERRSRLFSRLEDAAEVSLGSLETVFRKSGVKIDPILNEVRREYDAEYDGEGGPFIPADELGALPGVHREPEPRLARLMATLERVNLMRLAAERMPYAMPVRGARFTSGFGVRRDPKNGRQARHDGVDLAGRRASPIFATAAGEVAFAGRRGGYGAVIEIEHAFGHETVYAHLSRIRVKAGDAVERGDRIGDMGSTGRSTGVHLHYEVRLGGTPVNPLNYIEAARNVL